MAPPISTVPNEMLSQICSWLDIPSLKCFRLTRKHLRDTSYEYIFRRVHAPLERNHEELMKMLSEKELKHTVESIIFSKIQGGAIYTQGRSSDRQRDTTSEIEQTGLQESINDLENLKEVTYLYWNPDSKPTKSQHGDPEGWVVSHCRPKSERYGLNEFMLVHNALATSTAKIQLLRIINLGVSIFEPSKSISFKYWSLLTRLELSLVDDKNDNSLLQEGLKPVLQTLQELRYLRIFLTTEGVIPFDSVLESSFMWPHLKALCLGGFRSEEEELKTMINGKIMSEVESLCLKKIQLNPGWEEVMCQDEVVGRESALDLIKKKFTTYHLHHLPEFSEELSEGDCPFCVRWMET